jgi:hypothetical protein
VGAFSFRQAAFFYRLTSACSLDGGIIEDLMYPHVAEEELERRVRLYLVATRPELARLDVQVQGSAVVLTGRVGSFYLRQLALAAAQRVAGVQEVADAIEVASASTRREAERRPALVHG